MAEIFTHLLQEVPPLDVPELLAYFVKQSGPFLDQLGVSRGTLLCLTSMKFHCQYVCCLATSSLAMETFLFQHSNLHISPCFKFSVSIIGYISTDGSFRG
jgi:hypothetical protein